VVVIFLFSQKIVLGNSVSYEVDFVNSSRFVRGPFPEGRVEPQSSSYLVKYEPVYFSAYSPRRFNRAKVRISYRQSADLKSQIGLKLDVNDWAFYFEPLPPTDHEVQVYETTFDLTRAELIRNQLKFVIAAPGIDNQGGWIEVYNLQIELLK